MKKEDWMNCALENVDRGKVQPIAFLFTPFRHVPVSLILRHEIIIYLTLG